MENSPDTLYRLIGRDTVRLSLTKWEPMKKELQARIDWMTRAVVKILEANKQ